MERAQDPDFTPDVAFTGNDQCTMGMVVPLCSFSAISEMSKRFLMDLKDYSALSRTKLAYLLLC